MIRRFAIALILIGPLALHTLPTIAAQSAPAAAQKDTRATTDRVPRAIRRDVPLTNAIRRAYEAGTRDQSGRPGPNYWQLQTDYTIDARLDPATDTITGTETITAAQQQPAGADRDRAAAGSQHLPRPRAARHVGAGGEHRRDGASRSIAVNGETVDLTAPPAPAAAAAAAAARRRCRAPRSCRRPGSIRRVARITLATPIAAKCDGEARNRVAHEAARRARRTRPSDDAALRRHALPADAVVSARRGVRRPARLGHEPLPRARRSSTTTSAASTCSIDVPGRLDRQRHRRAAESAGGADAGGARAADARARVGRGHHDRRPRRGRSRQVDRRRAIGSSGISSPTTVNDFAWATAKKFVWTATRATIPGKGPVPIHMVYRAGARAAATPTRARSRVTRSSSTRSSGRRTRSRSSRCRTGRAPAWSTRWSSTRTRGRPITRPATSGGR